jgi:hypothetical protein
MTGFDDRKKSEDARFALDQELEFKAMARRAKLIGLWVAELVGKSGDAAAEYAREMIMADLEEAGDEDLFRKVRADLDRAGVAQTDHQIQTRMAELMVEARAQIRAGN